ERLGISKKNIDYSFLTMWLALNEENYRRYRKKKGGLSVLEQVLIGNILSMCKGLGYVVSDAIKVNLTVREVRTTLKGTPMLGFLGNFRVNFEIPEFLGLGKSVSRGFGTIGRL
ncbi:MAG: CRISPR-associated endonuclease Cas6, partial [candidate division WOR-3 bacterium]